MLKSLRNFLDMIERDARTIVGANSEFTKGVSHVCTHLREYLRTWQNIETQSVQLKKLLNETDKEKGK